VHRNWLFMGISTIMVGVQILIVFEGGRAFPTVPLTGVQWGISVGLALFTLPLGALIRCIPNGPLEKAANRLRGKKRAETPPISAAPLSQVVNLPSRLFGPQETRVRKTAK
jgi:P-type Ca2+ transporter type 2C